MSQYFISPQRPFYNLLKWEEINSNQILTQKVGPLINTRIKSSEITSFFYSDSKTSSIINSELYPEVSYDSENGSWLRLYGTAGIIFNDKLTIQNEFEFDNRSINNPHFQGIERESVPGWVGYLQHSSLNFIYSSGHLSVGRGNPNYFNMNESLLINPNFPPAEYVWWHHENQWIQFDWGLLMLNKRGGLNRFLTFHRYGISRKNWRVGFSEAVLGTYENWGSEEMGYIMPAAVLLETEENRGSENGVNLMWLLDGIYKWKDWTFYGEFLIDDFALDGLSPPQIAGSIGLGRKMERFLVNIEYTHINRWVGNYCDSLHIWVEKDVPIGHSIGSDANQFLVNCYYPLNEKISVDISFSWMESGIGIPQERLMEWPEYVYCDYNFGDNEPFPAQRKTTTLENLKLYFLVRENLLLNLKISAGQDQKAIFGLAITYHYY